MPIAHSEIAKIYLDKGFSAHFYCADNEAEVRFCLSEPSCVLITANNPVPLMKALGRI